MDDGTAGSRPDIGHGHSIARRRWRLLAAAAAIAASDSAAAETWRGLTVAPEHRCSSYDKKRDYRYPQSVEQDIVRGLGAVYGPYTGTVSVASVQPWI